MSQKTTKWIFSICCAVLLCVLVVFYIPKAVIPPKTDVEKLVVWSYRDDHGNEMDFSLPRKLYQDRQGDIEIFTQLPEAFDEPQVLCFWTFYQSVKVYVEDELIYDYDNSKDASFGKASSSRWNIVQVHTPDAGGKRLTVRMNTPYTDINLRLTEVVYGGFEEVHEWLERSYGPYQVMDTAFAWIGILFAVLAVVIKIDKRYKLYLLYAGITLILFSVYLRTGTKTLPIHWLSDYARELLCFLSLLMLSIPFSLYIRTRMMDKKLPMLWCSILAIADVVAVIVLFSLHALGVLDLHLSMRWGLLLLIVTVLTGVIFAIDHFRRRRTVFSMLTVVSILLMILALLAEYLQFYQFGSLPFDTGVLSHICAVLVIAIETSVIIFYLREESEKRSKVTEENRSLQIQMLTSQIRPHFILNTVGAIRTLIKEDADRASDLLYDFSKYIRNNLEQRDYTRPIPFPEELDYIDTYLKLERARFGDRIKVEYDIETRAFWVLPLTVQPFVENAVKHGLFPTKNGGTLKVSTRTERDAVVILIEDNGVGFDINELDKVFEEKKSVGIRSAIMRLECEMGAKVTMNSDVGQGTCVRIELPHKAGGEHR